MIKLSKRLTSIALMVDDNARVVDIGCDHGLLDIYLYKNKKNIKIIASDVNDKALKNAIVNIKRAGLSDKITTIVSDGLDEIDTSDLNTIIISGMGAHTMAGILQNNFDKLKTIDTIILQSNNDIDFLREKLSNIGYYIEDEKLVKEKKFIYTIIKFKKGHKYYSKKELFFGPVLIKENDKLFREKVKLEINKLEVILSLIPKGHFFYKYKTKKKLKMCKDILKRA
ncbi:MAG: class I SAM-dependent methyltransferase [Bacilli bacterium]|nr:class I SAM-dependent methyltransferase [Bacilli bacterium]